ncbi:LSU ribosomal protein L4p (L1e) [Mucinivorans hirudinis]|uniref:Large ribosomal subunit protein uL4 n=1 Tax=Mucinivorans hirudinis TaxID=1433126 RepID=A0A060RCE3_9BACT|nr:LSU ribosomal protein L4p (L1e) [Mucinivorans hirudinis]
MEIKVKNIKGVETGKTVILNDAIFGITPNDHAIYLDVKQYLAAQRQGTHKSKQRNEVAGSTRKLKRQKGTGGARCGSILSGTMVGGGRIFGPQPRNYDFKLNKKLKQLARRSALAYKAQSGAITVVDNLTLESPKTKEFIAAAKNLALTDKKLLIVLSESDANLILASRNIQKVKVTNVGTLNTYDVMNCSAILMGENAVEAVNQILA